MMNFCKAFADVIFNGSNPPMTIIADRCERKTVKMLELTGIPYVLSDCGNAGSLRLVLQKAIELPEDELVYVVEDDYLHLPTAPQLLLEGIRHADYITLYDHPDKYTSNYNGGEVSKVIRTPLSHWRFTISTCMTFATKVGTLKEDFQIWQKYISGPHPHDHLIFTDLSKIGRKLAVPIPGAACHTDLEFSTRVNYMLIDSWAIEQMISHLQSALPVGIEPDVVTSLLKGKSGLSKLMALDAIHKSELTKH